MRVSRLYVSEVLNVGQSLELNEESAHYVRTVLRLKKDQPIALFNDSGNEFNCYLELVSRQRVSVKIIEEIKKNHESLLQINLGLGISRGDRMDWAIQKSVELGVNQLAPLFTERCVVKLTDEKKRQRFQHWKNIIQHAAEQCNRTLLPAMDAIEEFQQWIDHQNGLKIFLDPYAEKTLKSFTEKPNRVTILSGPEGGFSDRERDLAVKAGFIPVKLGKRILRTETAALASLSAMQTLWGDFC